MVGKAVREKIPAGKEASDGSCAPFGLALHLQIPCFVRGKITATVSQSSECKGSIDGRRPVTVELGGTLSFPGAV